jgi:hypothetical protein
MRELLVICLATFGISYLLVEGIGPAGILSAFRYWLGVRFHEDGSRYGLNWRADLFNCVFCMSVWWCIPVTVVTYCNWWFIVPLAAVGLCAVLHFVFDNVEDLLEK